MSASNPHPDTTTVSTIVLQSGPVRLVVAILQVRDINVSFKSNKWTMF